jgi:hypothetical protein
MPESTKARWMIRVTAALVTVGSASGVLAVAHSSDATPLAAPKAARATTSTTAPPVVVTSTTTPPTTSAPTPPPTSPPTTAAPRPRVVAAAPTPAPVSSSYATQTVQERGEQALALINYPWQKLGFRIDFLPGRSGILGLTSSSPKVISIYVRDNESLDTLARTIAHEMGHALDFTRVNDSLAAQYIAIRGIDATPATWFGCNECSDYQTAAGDFAESFQYWLLGDGQFLSQMGPKPTSDQLAQLTAIFTI